MLFAEKIMENHQVDLQRLDKILAENGTKTSALIPVLRDIHKEYRYLPQAALLHVATAFGLSPDTVFAVATFYAHFPLGPQGKYEFKVCTGAKCSQKGSQLVYDVIYRRIGLINGQAEIPAHLYTVEKVPCLGACDLAPAITINDRIYGEMTPEAMDIIFDVLEGSQGIALENSRMLKDNADWSWDF